MEADITSAVSIRVGNAVKALIQHDDKILVLDLRRASTRWTKNWWAGSPDPTQPGLGLSKEIRPRRIAERMACVLSLTFSFEKMLAIWFFTVFSANVLGPRR